MASQNIEDQGPKNPGHPEPWIPKPGHTFPKTVHDRAPFAD
jgi:hypothetical protein